MNLNQNNGVSFLTFPSFEEYPFVNHAFSTRIGGVSKGKFSSINLNFGHGDSRETVLENFHIFCEAAGFSFDSMVASAQDHRTTVRRVTSEQCGMGYTRPKDRKSVDGLITDEPGVTLVTYYADCTPLFFLDPVHRAVGLAHSGWRGTAMQIGKRTVERMHEEFGTSPEELITAIGPSIGPCCYEVDQPVYDQFIHQAELHPEAFLQEKGDGKYMLDLWEANRRILLGAGVQEDHIEVAGLCTQCHSDLFYSHRVLGPERGGMAAMIAIRK